MNNKMIKVLLESIIMFHYCEIFLSMWELFVGIYYSTCWWLLHLWEAQAQVSRDRPISLALRLGHRPIQLAATKWYIWVSHKLSNTQATMTKAPRFKATVYFSELKVFRLISHYLIFGINSSFIDLIMFSSRLTVFDPYLRESITIQRLDKVEVSW